jgi:hypothetical protein
LGSDDSREEFQSGAKIYLQNQFVPEQREGKLADFLLKKAVIFGLMLLFHQQNEMLSC